MSGMRIGSLFSGYGGLDLAAQAVLRGRVAWHSDIKPAACQFLAHRFPSTPNIGDIITVNFLDVEPVDVLTFGWPCQPHSPAGKRLGEQDPRALWPHVHRAARDLRPRILLGENVARVTSNGELRRVVRSLAEIGYVGAYRTLRASDVGAPHRRDRLFLVAVRADVAPDALGLVVRDEPGRGSGPGGSGAGVAGDDGTKRSLRLLKTPTANLGSNGGSQHPDKRKAGGHGPTLADEVEWLLSTPTARDSKGPSARGARSDGYARSDRQFQLPNAALRHMENGDRWGIYADAVARWARVLGRLAPEPVMPSPKAGAKPVLSPAFVEWMMGLPAGWVADVPGLSRSQQLSMLGDGVVPQQAAAAYRELLAEFAQSAAA